MNTLKPAAVSGSLNKVVSMIHVRQYIRTIIVPMCLRLSGQIVGTIRQMARQKAFLTGNCLMTGRYHEHWGNNVDHWSCSQQFVYCTCASMQVHSSVSCVAIFLSCRTHWNESWYSCMEEKHTLLNQGINKAGVSKVCNVKFLITQRKLPSSLHVLFMDLNY